MLDLFLVGLFGRHGLYLQSVNLWHNVSQHGVDKLVALDQIQSIKAVRHNCQLEVALLSISSVARVSRMLVRIVNQFQVSWFQGLQSIYNGIVHGSSVFFGRRRRRFVASGC